MASSLSTESAGWKKTCDTNPQHQHHWIYNLFLLSCSKRERFESVGKNCGRMTHYKICYVLLETMGHIILGESEITSTLLGHSLILNHKTWGNSWEIPITSKGPMMKLNQMRSWVNLGSYAFCYKFNQSLHVDIVDCILKFSTGVNGHHSVFGL